MILQNLKGTFDYLPEEQKIRDGIRTTLKECFERYGYMPLETPILNYYELLAGKYEEHDEILNETYKLTDQGNRKIGLRYDLTVPFCKVVGLHKELRFPFRRYEIGKVFRNGPVKAGRTREFYQCDVDVVGVDGRYIEIELMDMGLKAYQQLGIRACVHYNNRKFMNGLIIESGIKEQRMFNIIGIIDKMDKVSKEELYDMFSIYQIDPSMVDHLLSLFTKTLAEYDQMFKNTNNPLLREGIDELLEIDRYIESLGIRDQTEFDPLLSRGLEVYTGIVFEFKDMNGKIRSSLGGGGRYDKIITQFMDDGKEYPAVGFSFGLEPIYEILKQEKKTTSLVDFYLIPMGTEVYTLNVANALRDQGYRVIIEMNQRKVKKCFEYADHERIPFVMILGEDEMEKECVSVKNMKTGEQRLLSLSELSQISNYLT